MDSSQAMGESNSGTKAAFWYRLHVNAGEVSWSFMIARRDNARKPQDASRIDRPINQEMTRATP